MSSSDRLATYRAKRDFGVTPEPGSSQVETKEEKKTAPEASATSEPLAFVVQKHDARRLHYDVRLEVDGAMVSWAVPKGPSFDPAVRRLAVQTEDHPMEYNAFEGRIPDGEYGAGDVLIWDRGTYETVPPGQQRPMLDKGHMHVRLYGEKLVGDWHIIRTNRSPGDDGAGNAGKAQWLLFKAKDARANPAYDVVAERPESVVSGKAATRGPLRVGASEKGKSARALIEFVGEPMLATADVKITRGDDWLFEIKYDGYRLMTSKAGSDVRVYTRRSHDWTDRFRFVAESVARLPARECVVDGEACVLDDRGRPSFGGLQDWLASVAVGKPKAANVVYAVFDLLWIDGRDLRPEPIEVRRELLEALLRGQPPPMTLSRAVEGKLEDLLAAAKAGGLEGLVAKRRGSAYVGGRGSQWVKLRFDRRQECAIVGYIPMAGTRDDVGALLLAVVEPARPGVLVFSGRVGTGFDTRMRGALGARLNERLAEGPQIQGAPRIKDARWVTPGARLRVRLLGVDPRRFDAPPALRRDARGQGPARLPARRPHPVRVRAPIGSDVRARARGSSRAGGRARPRARASPRLEARQPGQGPLPSRRDHQARDLGLLHGDCPADAPAPGGPSADPPAVSERNRRGRVVPAERPGEVAGRSCASSTPARGTRTRSASSATTSRRSSGSRTSRR